jgi:hypothetical protein
MTMKIRDVKSVEQLGKWMQERGLSPGENRLFGGVHPVHSDTSLHYRQHKNGSVQVAPNKQGDLAIDLNDQSVADDIKKGRAAGFKTEADALDYVYSRIHTTAEEEGWPLNEMFFSNRGFIKETGFQTNHPITGHEDHLHVAFDAEKW